MELRKERAAMLSVFIQPVPRYLEMVRLHYHEKLKYKSFMNLLNSDIKVTSILYI